MRFLARKLSFAAAVLLLAGSLQGCSSALTPAPSVSTNGYLYAAPSEAIFVRWAGPDAATGSVDWRTAPSQRITGDFAVEKTDTGFSFTFEPGTLAGWTGRFEGSGIVLLIPGPNGGFRDVALRPATAADFERAASGLR
ncbi:MAG TPA: hypothetical protein VIV06_07225 [Candidatus Limnocylindrales bacterium]